MSARIAHRLLAVAGWNAALAVAAMAAVVPEVPGPLRMAGAGLAVLVLPGAAWLGTFRRPLDPPKLALAVVALSSLITIAGLLASALGGQDPSRPRLLLVTAVCGSVGVLAAGPPRRLARGSPWPLLAGIVVFGFALASSAALWLVPPIAGDELAVRGTAWGLATSGRPWFQTERGTPLALAQPLLFHAQVAQSLLLTEEIRATERSSSSARATAAARAVGLPVDTRHGWQENRAAFLTDPALTGTRAPSALLTALTLGLLFELLRRLTGSRTAGLAGAALFALSPAALVGAASAGYGAPATFAMLTAALLTEAPPLGQAPGLGWIAAAAALCALVDHKTAVLVVGALSLAAGRALLTGIRAPARRMHVLLSGFDRRTLALAAGFLAGTLGWWSYGLGVDPQGFMDQHPRLHFAWRPALWAELSRGTGHGLIPVALGALCVWAVAAGAAEPRRALAGWGLAGAALWCPQRGLAAMVVAAVALAWTGLTRRPRTGGEPLHAVPRAIAWTAAGLLAASLLLDLRDLPW